MTRRRSSGDRDVSVPVRVRPGAGGTRVGGRYDGPHGPALIIAVGAPAVDGRATEAVRRALAQALGVRAAGVTLRMGATSRDKVFTVSADSAQVADRLRVLRDGHAGTSRLATGRLATSHRPSSTGMLAGTGQPPTTGTPSTIDRPATGTPSTSDRPATGTPSTSDRPSSTGTPAGTGRPPTAGRASTTGALAGAGGGAPGPT